jgi:hypothetical protein
VPRVHGGHETTVTRRGRLGPSLELERVSIRCGWRVCTWTGCRGSMRASCTWRRRRS